MTGLPGTLRPATDHHSGMSAAEAKALGLESILWVAKTQPRRSTHLRGVHARAARLPGEWWRDRTHWPIESLIVAVEQATPLAQPAVQGVV